MLSHQAHQSDILLDGSPGLLWTIKDLTLDHAPPDFTLPFPEQHSHFELILPSSWHLSRPRFPLNFDVITTSYDQPRTGIRYRLSSCDRIDADSPPFKLTLVSKFRFPHSRLGTEHWQTPRFFTIGLSPATRYDHPSLSEGYYATYVYEPDLEEPEGGGEGEKDIRDVKLSLLYRGSLLGINSCVSGRAVYRGLSKHSSYSRWEVRVVDYPPAPTFPSPQARR